MSVYNVLIYVYLSIVATVRLSASKYNTSESVGIFPGMKVCADLINATLQSGQNMRIDFKFSNGSALENRKRQTIDLLFIEMVFFVEDYFQSTFDTQFFNFIGPNTQACITIRITDDTIKEPLLEFFNITLLPYDSNTSSTPGYTGLTVDTTPSSICIEDDDRKLI